MQSVCTFIGYGIFHSYDLHFFPLLLVLPSIRSILFFLFPVFHLFNFIFTDTFSIFNFNFNFNFNFLRVIASLDRVMSRDDIAGPVLDALKREFSGMMKKKSQQYVDNKVRNVRYLAELVKFGVAPPIVAFRMFKTMMTDFSPHNIELTAILLENCGR